MINMTVKKKESTYCVCLLRRPQRQPLDFAIKMVLNLPFQSIAQ